MDSIEIIWNAFGQQSQLARFIRDQYAYYAQDFVLASEARHVPGPLTLAEVYGGIVEDILSVEMTQEEIIEALDSAFGWSNSEDLTKKQQAINLILWSMALGEIQAELAKG